MTKRRVVLGVMLTVTFLTVGNAQVFAQITERIGSGSNASDYQPPTDNPQSDVGSGLQTGRGNLQPLPGQAVVTQEKLGGVKDLQVIGTKNPVPNPNSTKTEAPTEETKPNRLPQIIIFIGVLITVIYIIAKPEKSAKSADSTATTLPTSNPSSAEVAQLIAQKQNRKSSQKKNRKNRKK